MRTTARWCCGLGLLVLVGCGGSGSSSGTATGGGGGGGGSGGSAATAGTGGAGGSGATGVGGSAGVGGAAASGGGGTAGGGGSGANDGWYATTEWTSLPIPLQFGPTMAPHPSAASELTVLATSYSGTSNGVVAATSSDLGQSFGQPALLSVLPQTAMAEPKGVAYNPKNPLELAAIVWIQGSPTDPESGGHLFRSTDGGKSFLDTGLDDSLPMNALAFSRVRYSSDGLIAIRTGASVVFSADGATTTDSVSTPGCTTSPGNAEFDVSPTDGKQVAVPCGTEVAICNQAGCTKSSSIDGVTDVAFGTDAQHVAAVGSAGDGSMSAWVSEDGGKTWSAPKLFEENLSPSWRVDWDPRPGKHIAYALLFSHLFQSSDGGKTWLDVTPPAALNYLYDFVVAADGTLIGRGVFHYLIRPTTE